MVFVSMLKGLVALKGLTVSFSATGSSRLVLIRVGLV
jgi:hypothetical protein